MAKLESSGDFVVDRASRSDAEAMVRRAQRSAYVVIKPGFGAGSERMFYGEPRHSRSATIRRDKPKRR